MNWFNLVQFGSIWFNLVQFGSFWFELIRFGSNLVQFGSNSSILVQIRGKTTRIHFDLVLIGVLWLKLWQNRADCTKIDAIRQTHDHQGFSATFGRTKNTTAQNISRSANLPEEVMPVSELETANTVGVVVVGVGVGLGDTDVVMIVGVGGAVLVVLLLSLLVVVLLKLLLV